MSWGRVSGLLFLCFGGEVYGVGVFWGGEGRLTLCLS